MSKIVTSLSCFACYGLLASDLSNQSTQLQPSHPRNSPIPAIICNIYFQCAHYQEGTVFRQINANLNLSEIAHLPFHISNTNPNAMIQFFNNSIRFQLWILLSNHNTNVSANISLLKQTIRIPTSQMALDILGGCIIYEEASKIGITGIAAKVSKDPDGYCKLQSHVPEQNMKSRSYDASPLTSVMWIPIKHTIGNLVEENFEIKGGEFVFPDDSCSIKFSGFNGIVECSWKAIEYFHLTLPSNTPSKSLHNHGAIVPAPQEDSSGS
ncbi:hypothetical protein VP01_5188g2 [Puccinia sorghi]|uniref:Tet-like 2OG-Fe(II) oxygenase domain-containing protein n=1 Tax=Puccinia sorghi TaxID=27349 RepID=A0A0L6UKT7_9BASI|nr:hypothetical protein VP01_5188g2 [Puccinia sorghi]